MAVLVSTAAFRPSSTLVPAGMVIESAAGAAAGAAAGVGEEACGVEAGAAEAAGGAGVLCAQEAHARNEAAAEKTHALMRKHRLNLSISFPDLRCK